MELWECAACHRPIQDHKEGYLVADDDLDNWRIVHRVSCDPHTGPWHPLEAFLGKRGMRVFRSMERGGAFHKLPMESVEALRSLVVRETYDEKRIERTKFRQWLRQQEERDDPIGDLARDMAHDHNQTAHNPSLPDLYHYLKANRACREAFHALIEAYREWQSYGNTYRETKNRTAVKVKAARLMQKKTCQQPKPMKARSLGWLALRFRILKRDGYRCQLCGRTAQDGVKLEIDHKIARSKGGDDTEGNLWVLCFDCNRGKRDADL